jgi:hypothetical protein
METPLDRSPTEWIAHYTKIIERGNICPAEFWHLVISRLPDQDVADALDSMSPSVQKILRDTYADRPHSLIDEMFTNTAADECDYRPSVRLAVREWCERR